MPPAASSAPPPALLTALREGTRDLHARAEAAFVLGTSAVTRAEYGDVLARMLGWYAVVEGALAAWAPVLAGYGVDLAARRKVPLLQRDLRALGRAVPADFGEVHRADEGGVGPATPVPSAAHAFGTLYVVEGATLGGQLLRRRLESALGLTPAAGLAFFTAYGADVGPMWRAFGEAVGRFDAALAPAARPGAHADAVAGARVAFLAFERDVVAPSARPLAPAWRRARVGE